MQRVLVIGAGISGLAAAHKLQRSAPDLEVTLVDANHRAGGVLNTERQAGLVIESAAENFITSSPEALELCKQVGLADQLISTNPHGRGAMVVRRGRLLPIPKGFLIMAPSRLWPLVSTKILSPIGKLRVALECVVPSKKSDRDESLKSFVCRRFGDQLFDRIVQPLVGGIYTADPAQLSLAATMPRFREMERQHGSLIRAMWRNRKEGRKSSDDGGVRYSQFVSLREGMSSLVNALVQSLPKHSLRLKTPVSSILPSGTHRWKVRVKGSEPTWIDTDAVIVAAPAHQAANILSSVDGVISNELREIEYASCAVVTLAYRRADVPRPLDSFGFLVPICEQRTILSCTFSSVKYEHRAPAHTVLMRVFIGGACQSGLLRLSSNELMELAEVELSQLLRIRQPPFFRQVVRHSAVRPQYRVGHLDKVANIERLLQRYPTLALAGNALHGVGIPSCIVSGQKAAARVLAGLRSVNDQSSSISKEVTHA